MSPVPLLSRVAAIALLAASIPAAADYWGDYGNAMLGERLRRDRPGSFWTDLVARPANRAETTAGGPRTWVPYDQSPWANTYGTPAGSGSWPAPPVPPSVGIVRLCACYLPADARSWDGGPLTEADVVRLCHAQCY